MRHQLKCWPIFYRAILMGEKRFELRRNDRNFQAGDELVIREYDPARKEFTGDALFANVTYILTDVHEGIADGFCVMSLSFPGTVPDEFFEVTP